MTATSWRARFFEESDLFTPIREVAERFAGDEGFPSPERIDERLRDRAPVRFVRASQKDKEPYDARIVNEGIVRTRDGSWHDFLNALVWATFPLSKTALHRRQHRIVVPGAPQRTPEGDALAMLDEGGVFVTGADQPLVVFGHAIYEGLVLDRPVFGAGLEIAGDGELDRCAAACIADANVIRTSRDLTRIDAERLERDRRALTR
jgi:hypothetical protein